MNDVVPETGQIRIEYIPLSQITRWPRNPKLHDQDTLGKSIDRFGFVQPLLLDEATGRLIAGHGRLENLQARKAAGEPPPSRVQVAGDDWLVPVTRGVSFKSDQEAEAYLIADNRLVELGGWDDAALAEMMLDMEKANIGDLATMFDGLGVGRKEYDRLLRHLPQTDSGQEETGGLPDVAPRSRLGDLWELGPHRLVCGDCTNPDVVGFLMNGARAELMMTDPPYGVDYVATKAGIPRSGFDTIDDKFDDIVSDGMDGAALTTLLDGVFSAARDVALVGRAPFYVCHPSGDKSPIFAAALMKAFGLIHRTLVWVKPSFVLTRSGMYHWRHEPIFYGWSIGVPPRWLGEMNQSSVWEIGRDHNEGTHPTQKPVELFKVAMRNHTIEGDICYEPFSGSGSQLIAGDQIGRVVYAVEIVPRYVDAAVSRWEAMTGKTASLLGNLNTANK